jgi:hypothetical protein
MITYLRENGYKYVEPTESSVTEWVEQANRIAEKTLYTEARSWYKGDNIPGKPSTMLMYPGGFDHHSEICKDVEEAEYEGYKITDSVEGLSERLEN